MPRRATKTIAVATMKGGSGKTTMAVGLAGWWMKQGIDTALIDADPQRSAQRWVRAGTDLAGLELVPLSEASAEEVADTLASLRRAGYGRIVIDTPGFRAPILVPLLRAAQLILVPIKASPVDFEVAADTVDMIREHTKSKYNARFVLSQTLPRSVVARHMREELVEAKYPLLDAEIPNRVVHAEAPFSGSTPSFTAPNSAAARELEALALEVGRLLGERTTDA